MAKYTMELRTIIENEKLFPPIETDLALTNILKNYPIFKEVAVDRNGKEFYLRDELNNVILNHFYFREIGFETAPRFLFHLNRKMFEIMPLYNQRFESTFLNIKPTDNVDMSETFEHTTTGNGTTTTTGTNTTNGTTTNTNNSSGDNINVLSDTPQQEISETDIKNNKFASKTNYDKNSSTNTDNITTSNEDNSNNEINQSDSRTESWTRREYGSSKGYTFAQNIQQWREIMLNVNMEIVKELEELFINVW